MDKLHTRVNRLCALFLFGASLLVFLLTAAPTVAFWDCGENIAAAHSLGVTHPPGSPLFIMILRVSSLFLSFVDDAGCRMNIAVAVISALTAVFIYLAAVRIIIALFGVPDTFRKRAAVYIGGLTAGFFAVFGKTFWFSAVEASGVNAVMLLTALSCWLALVWAQSRSAGRDRLLLLTVFICFAGMGIHIYSMITLLPIFLFAVLVDGRKLKEWRFGALVAAFAVIGLSTNLYLPIRSSTEPFVNVGQPSAYGALKDYLWQKPYGEESMFARMLWPRGSFVNQFGIEGHIGYGGYHITQFFRFSGLDSQRSLFSDGVTNGVVKLLIYLIPTFIMLYAWRYIYKKENVYALLLVSIFLLSSIFLIFYMNFADGTRPEKIDYEYWVYTGKAVDLPLAQREVRIRDYSFGGAYMFLGMWVGIGASIIMNAFFTSRRKLLRTVAAPAAAVLFAVSPALPLAQNWQISTRKNDLLPYDHSYNLLMSCEKDAILFTSGDNETFPLWALQEAYGIRRDVRVVNVVLLNEGWYIKQLKRLAPQAPISYTEYDIDTLRATVNPYENAVLMEIAGVEVVIPPRREQPFFRVQDHIVIDILRTNNWSRPIYFASAVPDVHKVGLGPYMRLEGLAQRVMPDAVLPDERVNIDRTVYLIDSVFKFRSTATGRDQFDETSKRMVYNYANTFIQLALALKEKTAGQKQMLLDGTHTEDEAAVIRERIADNINTAHRKLSQCVRLMPSDWRLRYVRHEVLMENGMFEEAERHAREAVRLDSSEHRYKQMLASALERQGRNFEANRTLRQLVSSDIDQRLVFRAMAKNFEEIGMYDSALHVARQYRLTHPTDPEAQRLVEYYTYMEQGK